ncbi:MAG: DNA repair protein RecO [Candidatus Schekmanbacteria bacterium]|nr:DNA repair protein RecO [Candidatus Schekmanbacteria bacterium]
MSLCRVMAFPAGSVPFSEASRIVTFLTPQGRLSALVRGVRRARSALRGVDILVEGELVAYQKDPEKLAVVREFAVRRYFPRLRETAIGLAAGSYALEVGVRFSIENDPQPRLYDHVAAALAVMDEALGQPRGDHRCLEILRVFELLALAAAGFAPQLDACRSCGRAAMKSAHLDAENGCVTCPSPLCCQRRPGRDLVLSHGTLAAMRGTLSLGGAALRSVRLDTATRRQWEHATRALIEAHLQAELRSREVLRSIAAGLLGEEA